MVKQPTEEFTSEVLIYNCGRNGVKMSNLVCYFKPKIERRRKIRLQKVCLHSIFLNSSKYVIFKGFIGQSFMGTLHHFLHRQFVWIFLVKLDDVLEKIYGISEYSSCIWYLVLSKLDRYCNAKVNFWYTHNIFSKCFWICIEISCQECL